MGSGRVGSAAVTGNAGWAPGSGTGDGNENRGWPASETARGERGDDRGEENWERGLPASERRARRARRRSACSALTACRERDKSRVDDGKRADKETR